MTAALDLLREARGVLSRLPRMLGGYHLDIGSRDKLLRRIDALIDAPQEDPTTSCSECSRSPVDCACPEPDDELWPGVIDNLDAPQVSNHCPVCEARAREAVYGYGVVDSEGDLIRFRALEKALAAATLSDEAWPHLAPHRVVELVARPERVYTAEHLEAARERAEETLKELGFARPVGERE